MKIKSVLAAIIAAAALSCTAVCAFADENPTEDQVTATADTNEGEATTDSEDASDGENADAADGEEAADGEGEDAADGENASGEESEASSIPENVSEAADPMEGNPVSGVDGAAALAGIAMVAGAALVISHKRG